MKSSIKKHATTQECLSRPSSDSTFRHFNFPILHILFSSWYSASTEDGCGIPLFEEGCCLRRTSIVFASFNKLLIFYAYLVKMKSKENKKISILRAFMYTFWAFVCVRVFTFCSGYMNFEWKLLMLVLFFFFAIVGCGRCGNAGIGIAFRWFAFVYVHEWMDGRTHGCKYWVGEL